MRNTFLLLLLTVTLLLALLFLGSCQESASTGNTPGGKEDGSFDISADDSNDSSGDPSGDASGGTSTDVPVKPPEPEHVHEWSGWVTKTEPTCTQEGEQVRRCICDETEKEPIPASGHLHVPTYVPAEGATPGYTLYECVKCKDSYRDEDGSKYAEGLIYEVNDDGTTCTITSHGTCTSSVLNIPPEIDGYTVTRIGRAAFRYYNAIKVIIPDTVTDIEEEAFFWCTELIYLTLGAHVENIGMRAFDGCRLLVDIQNRSSLTLEKGSTALGWIAKKAINIHTDDEVGAFHIVDAFSFYEHDGMAYLLAYDGTDTSVVLPNDLNGKSYEICYNAFPSTQRIYSISIPAGVTAIHDGAFDYQKHLIEIINFSSIDIVAGDTANGGIGEYAIEVHTGESKLTFVGDYIFYSLEGKDYLAVYTGSDVEVTLPTLEGKDYSVYDEIFYMSDIEKVTIPEGVISIGNDAFSYCSKLREVILPSTLSFIGEYAFSRCPLQSIVIPDSVTAIGGHAFSNSGLESIFIPASVKTIGDSAFRGCKSLKSVGLCEGLISIGLCAFDTCTALEEITIPNSVTSFGIKAFASCTSLKKAILGDSVASINYGFSNCISLVEIVLPSTIKEISFNAFEGCTSLKEITIPNSVEKISQGAFVGCASLVTIEIPDSVKSVFSNAFDGCTSLKNVKIGCGITSISSYAFRGTAIEDIVIPENVLFIEEAAFLECDNLQKVILPIGIAEISPDAFEGCEMVKFFYSGGAEDLKKEGLMWFADRYELYLYSENPPEDAERKYWHYDDQRNIVIW
jgi:hypothetical protein